MFTSTSYIDDFFTNPRVFGGYKTLKEVPRYPLTDIAYDDDKNVYVSIAVAGFDKSEIDVEKNGNYLVISGTKEDSSENELTYVQQYISNKSFERKIKLADEYVDGTVSAKIINGILEIKITPKEPKKSIITID